MPRRAVLAWRRGARGRAHSGRGARRAVAARVRVRRRRRRDDVHSSAKLWTRAPKAGPVALVVTGAGSTRRFGLTASRGVRPHRAAHGAEPATGHDVPLPLRPGRPHQRHRALRDRAGRSLHGCRAVRDLGRRRRNAGPRTASLGSTASRRTARWRGPGTTSTSTSETPSTPTPRSAARPSRGPSRRSGPSTGSGSRSSRCGAFGPRPVCTAAGTTTSSSTTTPAPSTASRSTARA